MSQEELDKQILTEVDKLYKMYVTYGIRLYSLEDYIQRIMNLVRQKNSLLEQAHVV